MLQTTGMWAHYLKGLGCYVGMEGGNCCRVGQLVSYPMTKFGYDVFLSSDSVLVGVGKVMGANVHWTGWCCCLPVTQNKRAWLYGRAVDAVLRIP